MSLWALDATGVRYRINFYIGPMFFLGKYDSRVGMANLESGVSEEKYRGNIVQIFFMENE